MKAPPGGAKRRSENQWAGLKGYAHAVCCSSSGAVQGQAGEGGGGPGQERGGGRRRCRRGQSEEHNWTRRPGAPTPSQN
eukprot:910673-Pyramimonas_sp.AAC.1